MEHGQMRKQIKRLQGRAEARYIFSVSEGEKTLWHKARHGWHCFECGWITRWICSCVVCTSKTKPVIDFEMFVFLFPLVQTRNIYSENELKTQKCAHCWSWRTVVGSSRDEVLRQGGQSVSHTPPNMLQHLPLLKLLQRTGKRNRSQINMICCSSGVWIKYFAQL